MMNYSYKWYFVYKYEWYFISPNMTNYIYTKLESQSLE